MLLNRVKGNYFTLKMSTFKIFTTKLSTFDFEKAKKHIDLL